MASAKSKRFNDPRLRGIFYQTLLVIAVSGLIGSGAYNAYFNMRARGIPLGFGFWNQVAGFDINLHLIDLFPAFNLWPRVLGWASQYPSRCLDLHSTGHTIWIRDRSGSSSAELAVVPLSACLYERDSEYSAAAAVVVLL